MKRAIEALLARGATPLLRRRQRGRVAVLAYHNVVPDGGRPAGDRSLHLPRRSFSDQLDALTDSHRVVPLEEILDEVANPEAGDGGTGVPPRAVITFDDAYHGAMTCGLGEVARRGLPATVFVSPGLLGADGFWWDVLRPGSGRDGVNERHDARRNGKRRTVPDRDALLLHEAGRSDAILARAKSEGWDTNSVPDHARPATTDELRQAGGRPGVTFGAHGWSHANLARLTDPELGAEMTRPREWLESEMHDAFVPVVAYPYGRFSTAAVTAARDAGYRAAFMVEGSSFAPSQVDAYRLPRINVPAGVSVDGFRLRLLGLGR